MHRVYTFARLFPCGFLSFAKSFPDGTEGLVFRPSSLTNRQPSSISICPLSSVPIPGLSRGSTDTYLRFPGHACYLNASGQYFLYRSYRGAILQALRLLQCFAVVFINFMVRGVICSCVVSFIISMCSYFTDSL